MFAEPKHPRLGEYTLQSTKDLNALVDRADAYALVFPEYNHTYGAALNDALDHLNREWAGKPVGLVSYGGVAAGARAAEALEPVRGALGMRFAGHVPIPFVSQFVSDGVFTPNEQVEGGTDGMLDTLAAALTRS